MTEPTAETGRPLDEETRPENEETPAQEQEETPEQEQEETTDTDPELHRLETLERHGQLTNAADVNRLAEIRGEDSNGEVDA